MCTHSNNKVSKSRQFYQDWTRKGGWRVIKSRTASYPGDPDYPRGSDRTKPADYAARGFKEAAI